MSSQKSAGKEPSWYRVAYEVAVEAIRGRLELLALDDPIEDPQPDHEAQIKKRKREDEHETRLSKSEEPSCKKRKM